MKLLRQTASFMIFALILEALWMLLRVDILEDFNIFAEAACWLWLAGAVMLHALLAATSRRIRQPLFRQGLVSGALAALFCLGLLVPRWIGGDGIAVGMLQYLNGYWILVVGAYFLFSGVLSVRLEGGRKAVPTKTDPVKGWKNTDI